MKLMAFFESATGAKIKDCIANDNITFIVEENDMGRAIGKSGSNIKKIENALKRRIKLVEFANDPVQFVRNAIYPLEVSNIVNENGTITIHGKDTNSKAKLIGREKQNLNHLTDIVKRYFDINDIRVV